MPMWKRSERRETSSVVDECEAYLTGRLADRMLCEGAEVPVWMWMNLLAHGRESDLSSVRKVLIPRSLGFAKRWEWIDRIEPWHQARSYLAMEVLDFARLHGPLQKLQRGLLVPIEDELAAAPSCDRWQPRDWVFVVTAALEEHRRAEERSERPHGLST
jgi:hypothetical protein